MIIVQSITTTYVPIHQASLSRACPYCGQGTLQADYFQLRMETRGYMKMTKKVAGLVSCPSCHNELHPLGWDDLLEEAYLAEQKQAVLQPKTFRLKWGFKLFLALLLLLFIGIGVWIYSTITGEQGRNLVSRDPKVGDLMLGMQIAYNTTEQPHPRFRWLKVEQVTDKDVTVMPYAGGCETNSCSVPPESDLQTQQYFRLSRAELPEHFSLNGTDENGAELHFFVAEARRP